MNLLAVECLKFFDSALIRRQNLRFLIDATCDSS